MGMDQSGAENCCWGKGDHQSRRFEVRDMMGDTLFGVVSG
jgi:hypothetical protein